MTEEEDAYNYMEIPLDELPSRGLMYDPGTYFRGRFLTIRDVKFTALITEENATRIVNEIIRRCFVTNIDFDDILLCDREYMAMWLRANSFMKDNAYRLHIEHCQHCNHSFDQVIPLDSIAINYLDNKPEDIILPRTKRTIHIKLPTIRDLSIISDDAEIQNIARMIVMPNPVEFVENLNAYDYAVLKSYCDKYKAGFDFDFKLQCPSCGKINTMHVIMADSAIFRQVDMRDIINLTLRITKYIGCYIPDSMPWPELEMTQDITNAINKEENDEMEKQEQKSRAQAAAMQAKYSSQKYRH